MTTCLETYATLRIFSESMAPNEIGNLLGVDATRSVPADPTSQIVRRRVTNFWAWSSEDAVSAVDNLQHIAAIISVLEGRADKLDRLRARGCQIDISCYWVSTGQGGPQLDSATLKSLAALDLPIWWDVYFGQGSDYETVKSR